MFTRNWLLTMLLALAIVPVGGIYFVQGVSAIADAGLLALDVEKNQLYIALGFDSFSDWKRSYLFQAYARLIGGSVFVITGLVLIVKAVTPRQQVETGNDEKPGPEG